MSVTGISTSRPPRSAGFTLVEILVVMVIIATLSVGAVLSLGLVGGDRAVTDERDRLLALMDFMREQAELENRDYGIRVFQGGYEFLVFDDRARTWVRVVEDKRMRSRVLPAALESRLVIEGRPVVLPVKDAKDILPQIQLYSSGDLNDFVLTVERPGDRRGFRLTPNPQDYAVDVRDLPETS